MVEFKVLFSKIYKEKLKETTIKPLGGDTTEIQTGKTLIIVFGVPILCGHNRKINSSFFNKPVYEA